LKETTEQRKNNQQSPLSWNLLKGKHHLRPINNMRSSKGISGIMKSALRAREREREREREKAVIRSEVEEKGHGSIVIRKGTC
jgi:hypothetical protein